MPVTVIQFIADTQNFSFKSTLDILLIFEQVVVTVEISGNVPKDGFGLGLFVPDGLV